MKLLQRSSLWFLLFCMIIVTSCTSEDPVSVERTSDPAVDHMAAPSLKISSRSFPEIIPLPNGFQPEGITVGTGTTFYVGSLANGSIFRGDLRTGTGEILVSPPDDRVAVGLSFDRRSKLLFVAGQSTGKAYVYDGETGEEAATYELTDESETFINDVIVTRAAAFFTDSFRPVIYRLPLGPRGQLPDADNIEERPLGGDFTFDPGNFNANGIDATPDGKYLIIVNSTLGTLYRVDPESAEAEVIDLGGESVPNGDGILLDGRTLYVVQNFLNQIAVIRLSPDLSTGQVAGTITSPDFDIPTTVAKFGNALFAVNAKFATPPTPDTEYEVVRMRKKADHSR